MRYPSIETLDVSRICVAPVQQLASLINLDKNLSPTAKIPSLRCEKPQKNVFKFNLKITTFMSADRF
jgi:hypothetical protein